MVRSPDESEAKPEQIEAESGLLSRVAQGDGIAAKVVVDRHLGAIVRFAYRMLGDAAEAEDVAQETFLRLWKEIPSWESRAKLSTWLHRVAHNLCIDRLRTNRSERISSVPERADPRPEAGQQLEAHRRTQALERALADLPERQRAAIALVYHQELSNTEASDVLGVSIDALESLLVRGRMSLRKRLEAEANLTREADERLSHG
jgi:RNA polymerase sigma-70 factor (ECF subfamily)